MVARINTHAASKPAAGRSGCPGEISHAATRLVTAKAAFVVAQGDGLRVDSLRSAKG